MADEKKYIEVGAAQEDLREYADRKFSVNGAEYANGIMAAAVRLKYLRAADVRPVVRDTPYMDDALQAVIAERRRQIELWGDQSGIPLNDWLGIMGEEYGELCEAINETTFDQKKRPERGGVDNVYCEACQLAAVAVQLMEAVLSGFRPDGADMRDSQTAIS